MKLLFLLLPVCLLAQGPPAITPEQPTKATPAKVTATAKVYVLGNVKKPGIYPFSGPDNTMTVLEAIAMCDGVTAYAQRKAYIYRKNASTGSREEIVVELSKILERKGVDVELRPFDILYIPDDKHKGRASLKIPKDWYEGE